MPSPVTATARESEIDVAFGSRLLEDANTVASRRQMHSEAHNPTCFKYAKGGSRHCRFNFPRPLVEETRVNSHGGSNCSVTANGSTRGILLWRQCYGRTMTSASCLRSRRCGLHGSFSEQQALEDSVRGGHPETDSMQNDLALVLLALLVPWERLPPLFADFDCTAGAYKDHCADIWANPSAPPARCCPERPASPQM